MDINKTMQESNNKPEPEVRNETRRPDEAGSIAIAAHVRIFDPNTKEIFVEKRA